jgi:uncharacterized membrane protein YeaQ/YmgE (transglycosylase-associated protein family)
MTAGEISILVWLSLGFASWHFCVFMPDKFVGGIGGALTVSLVGATVGGVLLPFPGIPSGNPPGPTTLIGPLVGAPLALGVSYALGRRAQALNGSDERSPAQKAALP